MVLLAIVSTGRPLDLSLHRLVLDHDGILRRRRSPRCVLVSSLPPTDPASQARTPGGSIVPVRVRGCFREEGHGHGPPSRQPWRLSPFGQAAPRRAPTIGRRRRSARGASPSRGAGAWPRGRPRGSRGGTGTRAGDTHRSAGPPGPRRTSRRSRGTGCSGPCPPEVHGLSPLEGLALVRVADEEPRRAPGEVERRDRGDLEALEPLALPP